MKKILLLSVLSLIVIASCKKRESNPSTTVTVSYPKITFTNQYYSIPVGGVRPTVQASAYDTFYKQSVKLITIDSTINTLTPGLYTGQVIAQSQYGFVSTATYYVAVTNVASSMDLSGHWIQSPTNDSISTDVVKLATGLYSSSNVDGENIFTNPGGVFSDMFVATSNTTLVFSSGNAGTFSYNAPPGISTMTYGTTSGGTVIFSR